MPRPTALPGIPPYLSHMEMIHTSLEEFFKSLTNADKVAFLNAIRSGALFNFTPSD